MQLGGQRYERAARLPKLRSYVEYHEVSIKTLVALSKIAKHRDSDWLPQISRQYYANIIYFAKLFTGWKAMLIACVTLITNFFTMFA
jgi:hypothetical protein